jgi:hypothetical protein
MIFVSSRTRRTYAAPSLSRMSVKHTEKIVLVSWIRSTMCAGPCKTRPLTAQSRHPPDALPLECANTAWSPRVSSRLKMPNRCWPTLLMRKNLMDQLEMNLDARLLISNLIDAAASSSNRRCNSVVSTAGQGSYN